MALRAATVGHTTTSPRRMGHPSSSDGSPPPGPGPPSSGERPPRSGSSSMGKASTSVGPGLPRKRSCSSAMVGSSTKSSDTSMSSRTPSAPSTARASVAMCATSTARSDCSSATKTSAPTVVAPGIAVVVGIASPRSLFGRCFVGRDDVGHNPGPHHIALGEVHELHLWHGTEDTLQSRETGASTGDVDLGDVTGHHDLGAETDAGEEHLHLLGGGVLGFVENDEAPVQCAAPHERERRNFDGAPVEQALGTLGPKKVIERVVQRPKIRVNLGHDVAREKSEPLARLDGRSGQDDAVDLVCLEGLDT